MTARTPGTASLDSVAADARHLATLLEVSQALSDTPDLKAALQHVLDLLNRQHGTLHGFVSLLYGENDLRTEASAGDVDAGVVRYGERVMSQVVARGAAIVVPHAGQETALLPRAPRRHEPPDRDVSLVGVPITRDGRAVGALAVDLPFEPDRRLDQLSRLLDVVASMIAQAVRVRHLIEEDRRLLADENLSLRQELRQRYDFPNLVGSSGPMRQVFEQVVQVAGAGGPVLIRGEAGTGKELIAHAIHYSSPRARTPFVKVSCAALPESLLESELFGYEKGAFTGAKVRRKGRLEQADGGTLFLDEVGDLNLATQVKLLRVVQDHEFERLGGTETVRVNVRLLAATAQDLERAVAAGAFRDDLLASLTVCAIFIPPLRERKADLLLLVDHFLEKFAREHRRTIKRISTPAIDMLASYHWPGNVRELENTLERAVLICDGRVIHAHHLPPSLQTAHSSGTVTRVSLRDAVQAYEKDLIQDALKTTRGNRAGAARLLDTTERIINYKMRRLRINAKRFRS
jgi:Nif-specific regulatory protein